MSDPLHIRGADLYLGDYREIVPRLAPALADVVLTDPPYGDTSLAWDDRPAFGWLEQVRRLLKPSGSVWFFCSLRYYRELVMAGDLEGWAQAQDIVWEKHNGSNFHADRFKRVHEQVVQLYPADQDWADIYKSPVTTPDATARQVRRKKRPTHTGHIEASSYVSEDGGPRLMRSVVFCRSCHGYAEHPTQKPLGILDPLISYSCPPGGTVLDIFAGSGSTAVAALLSGRRAIGIERSPGYFEIACRRCDRETAQGRLFASAAPASKESP